MVRKNDGKDTGPGSLTHGWWKCKMTSLYIITLLIELIAEDTMWSARLDEAQTVIKIARRNINNLRYAGDPTLMAESEEELKSLLMKLKEESEKAALKLNIQKTKIMASDPITSWQIDGVTMGTVTNFIWGGGVLQNNCRWWLQPWKKDSLEEKLWPI